MATRNNSFEGGSNNTVITTGNSGGSSGDAFNNIVGSPTYTNTVKRGSLAAYNPTAGADTHLDWTGVAQTGDTICLRWYIYFIGKTTDYQRVAVILGNSTVIASLWTIDGNLGLFSGFGDTLEISTDVPLPTNRWVRCELRFTINSSSSGTAELYVYNNPESSQSTQALSSATITWPYNKPDAAEFHLQRETNAYWYLDDVAVSNTLIGPAVTPGSGGAEAWVNAEATGGNSTSGVVYAGTASSFNAPLSEPDGCLEGDVGLVVVQTEAPTAASSGWTKLGSTGHGGGFYTDAFIAQRGAEPWDLSWLGYTYGDIAVYRGVDAIPDVVGQNDTSAVAPSVTTTVPNALLVCLYADYATIDASAPVGMTNRVTAGYNSFGDLIIETPGATGDKTFQNTDTPMSAWSVALAPLVTSESHSGGASASVSVTVSGAGKPGVTAGSSTTVSVTSSGAGKPGFSGSSSASVSVGTSSGVRVALSGGSSAAVSVSTAAGGSPSFSGSAGAEVSVDVSGEGQPALSAGSSADVSVDATGDATITISDGSGTSVTVSTTSSGLPGTSGGSEVSVNVTSAGDGNPGLTGGSTTSIDVTADGSGSPAVSNGVDTTVTVTSTGGGTRSDNAGGSVATIAVSATGAGFADLVSGGVATVNVAVVGDGSASFSGGSDVAVLVDATGDGGAGLSDGSNASVTVSVSGNGSPSLSGGQDTSVVVIATGGGQTVDEGGSTTTIVVSATGAGIAAFSSGSAADVEVAAVGAGILGFQGGSQASVLVHATGRGMRFAVDISVEVGPSRRRDLVAVNPTVVLERVSVGTSRQAVEIGDTRTSTTVMPSRIGRGE